MLMNLTLGAQVDMATGAEVARAKEEILDGVEGMFARVSRRPVYVSHAASQTIGSGTTGTTLFSLGSPPHNSVWNLVRLAVYIREGNDQVAIPNDTFGRLYIGSPDNAANYRGLVDPSTGVVDPSTPLPVQGNDGLYLVLEVQTGFTDDALVVVTALVAEYRDQAVVRGAL